MNTFFLSRKENMGDDKTKVVEEVEEVINNNLLTLEEEVELGGRKISMGGIKAFNISKTSFQKLSLEETRKII